MSRAPLLALTFATVCVAAPSVGPELPVDATLGAEPVNAFHFGVRLDAIPDGWALTWEDHRADMGWTWIALYDADGGVVVPGTRALATTVDFLQHGDRAVCARSDGTLLWVIRHAYSRGISVLRTTRDGRRLAIESYDAPGLTVDQALSCPADQPLWLTARNSATQGQYALEVRRVEVDAGTTSRLDGGVLREELFVSDTEFSYGFASGATTAWWVQGGADGLDLWAAPVSVEGVGAAQLIAGGPGHQSGASFAGAEAVWTEQLVDAGQRDVRTSFRTTPLASTPQDEDLPQLVFDGTQYVAAWRAQLGAYDSELRVAPIATNGQYGATTVIHRSWFDSLRLATNGRGQTMVAVRDFSRGIHAITYLLDGVVPRATPDGGPVEPAQTALSQHRALLTPLSANRRMLSWQQRGERLFRVLGDGDAGIGRLDLDQSDVRLGSNGSELLALDFTGRAQRLDATSLVSSPAFRWSSTNPSALSTPVWDGERFWFLAVVNGEMALQSITPPQGVGTPNSLGDRGEDGELAVTSTGNLVIAWTRTRELHVACREPSGNVRELLSVPAAYLPLPRVASSGRAAVVVFLADLPTGPTLDAFVIDSTCTVARRLSLGSTDWWSRLSTYVSTVEWDGSEFIVGWLPIANDRTGDVVVSAIDEAGNVRGPFAVSAVPDVPEVEPSIAVEGPGRWWIAYQRFEAQESISTRRAYYRLLVDDAGVRTDAGVVANDGGFAFDAGTTPQGSGTTRPLTVGFACTSVDGTLGVWLLVAFVVRRRVSAAR